MTQPVVSPITVVIPVYNRAHTVERTLRSIDAQTLKPAAVILVDNNSTDASLSILHSWASSRPYATVTSESRPGACAARNRGLELVETPFVMFFDSDDEMLPVHVADFTKAILSHPSVDIFGRDLLLRTPGAPDRTLYFSAYNAMFNHIFRGCLSTQRVVLRTELVRRVGGWDESLPGWDDFELGVRLLLATDRIYDLGGKPSVLTHFTDESITGTSFGLHPERWELSLETIRRDIRASRRSDLDCWVDSRSAILAAQYAREGREDLAESLMSRLLSSPTGRRYRHRLRLIYHHNRLFNRLTWLLARILF